MDVARKRILIHKITNLPTLPTVLNKIIELTESRNANAHDLGELLSKDPSISSLILKLVNSAYYGNLRHISSINHATVILGFQMVKTIAMGVSIYQTRTETGGDFDREKFWVHSLGTAYFARIIAAAVGMPKDVDKDTVFLSGLLHDVGKVILDNYFSEDYKKVIQKIETDNLWIRDAEMEVMGMDHTDAGFYLARKWQFPDPVVNVIRYHHRLEKCPQQHGFLCAVVHAADHCCRKIGLGSGGDQTVPPLSLMAEGYGITASILDDALREVDQNRKLLEEFVVE
ncbi:MAG: HDOD domain-containing protein [Acidobacteriota bacterium]|nr:HDOD domain-containing protein [Acidobacteriota bacterium]